VDSIVADPDCAIAYVNVRGKTAGRHIVPVIVSLPAGFSGLVGTIVQPRSISITLEKTAERTLDIDSQFTSPPPMGFRFGVPQILPIKAVIRGPTGKVDSVSQLAAAIDLDQPGMQSIDGDYAIVALDKGGMQIAGLEITPGRTHVHMELREAPVNRVVFVGVNAIGQPPFPYRVETIRIEPSTVTLAGRPEEVAKVGSIRTEPIQLANRTKTFTQKARIIAPEGLSLPDGGYVQVTVKIVSSPDTENKSPTTGTSD
jgi:YbbR domain-containing protein